jgi:hypothetical protein
MRTIATLRYLLPETSLIEAATRMRDLAVSALPVCRIPNEESKLRLDWPTECYIACRAVATDMAPLKAMVFDVVTHQAPADPSVSQGVLVSIAVT